MYLSSVFSGLTAVLSLTLCLQGALTVTFQWVSDLRTWAESREYCESLGRHLVTIHTKEDYHAVISYLLSTG